MGDDGKGGGKPIASAAIAGWGLVLYAGARAVAIVLEAQSMAASVGQALLVEWGASRLGVEWTRPGVPAGSVARRAAVGFAAGLGAAAVLFGVLGASRAVTFEPAVGIEPFALVIGFGTAALHAWRDELLLHGITLRALDGTRVADVARVLACGATSAGAALGLHDATAKSVFAAALLGVVYGALWVQDRGAWKAWAAHAGFRFATGTLLAGGLVHSRLADDGWAGGSAGILGGAAATVALAPLAILALAWAARGISPRSAPVG